MTLPQIYEELPEEVRPRADGRHFPHHRLQRCEHGDCLRVAEMHRGHHKPRQPPTMCQLDQLKTGKKREKKVDRFPILRLKSFGLDCHIARLEFADMKFLGTLSLIYLCNNQRNDEVTCIFYRQFMTFTRLRD